ncbi:hypothetical protein [Streptomyces tritici]|uniref:hypothetical protein n=1 Tax=Streptomyces tritici TaxID=2054410 RepID=UPI003AF0F66E
MELTTRQRRARAGWLLGGAAALVGAAGLGHLAGRDGGLLRVAQVLDHPLLFGALAFVAAVAGIGVAIRNGIVRGLVIGAAVLATIAAAPIALLVVMGSFTVDTLDEAAPGRTDRRLVVTEGADMIDPLWWVYVDTGSGLGVRRWQLGAFNGDDPANGLVEVRWDGPDRVRVVTGDGPDLKTHIVELDRDGRPLRSLTMGAVD